MTATNWLPHRVVAWFGCALAIAGLAACAKSEAPPPVAARPAPTAEAPPAPEAQATPPMKDGHAGRGAGESSAQTERKRAEPPGIGGGRGDIGAGSRGARGADEVRIGSAEPPPFPWPPPKASAEQSIPDKWLRTGQHPTLARVASKLDKALRLAHYPQWRYYAVPHGFALATHLEHIEADGAPLAGDDRWKIGSPSLASLSLFEFVKALARAPAGEYRAIVFIVTDAEWAQSATPAGEAEVLGWASGGLEALPPSIGSLPYGPGYRAQALIYQLRKRAGQPAEIILPSAITGEEHLDKSGLWEPLSIL